MNEKIFTKICTKYGFRVKKITPWSAGGDWYIAYFSSNKFNLVVASYDTADKDIATICDSLKKINFPFKIEVADTNYVKTVEELEQACMELKVKLKEMLEQIKLEQINSDF
jgi:hypothetical protein